MAVGALLVAGAAAAAVLVIDWSPEPTESVTTGTTMPGKDMVPSVPNEGEPGAASVTAVGPDSSPPDTTNAAQAREAGNVVPADGFTVAVAPIAHRSTHPDIIGVTESIYAAFLARLRSVPGLVLVELDEPIDRTVMAFETARIWTGAVSPPDGAGNETVLTATDALIEESDAAGGVRTFTLEAASLEARSIDAPAPSSTTAPVTEFFITRPAGSEPASLLRPNDVTAGTEGSRTSLVNVIVSGGLAAGRSAARSGRTAADDLAESANEPRYDFVVDVTSIANMDERSSQPRSFSFRVGGSRGGGIGDQVSLVMQGGVYDRVDAEQFAEEAVAELRKLLFAPDDTLISQIEAMVLDTEAPIEERLRALGELQTIAMRSGTDGRVGAVARAVIDMTSAGMSDAERTRLWRLMAGADDPILVRPLVDTLLYDSAETARLEAARALATFADDPAALAALERAGSFDPSQQVRQRALWSSLDEPGRSAYVSAALLDQSLPDADRVEPLLYATRSLGLVFDPNRVRISLDDGAASALAGIIARSPDIGRRAMLMPYLGNSDQPDVIAFLIDRLEHDPSIPVRGLAAEMLARHADDPAVALALESARSSDAAPGVRGSAASSLGVEVTRELPTR